MRGSEQPTGGDAAREEFASPAAGAGCSGPGGDGARGPATTPGGAGRGGDVGGGGEAHDSFAPAPAAGGAVGDEAHNDRPLADTGEGFDVADGGGPPGAGDPAASGTASEPAVFSAVDAVPCGGMPEPARAKPSQAGGDGSIDGDGAADGGVGSQPPADARDALAAIRDGIAALRDQQLWMIGQDDLLGLARQVEQAARTMYGIQVRLAGEIHQRGIAGMLDVRSAAHLLHQTLTITMADARGRVAAAAIALPGETPTGEVIDPAAPELLDAIDQGVVSAGQARVITRCLTKIPDTVDEPTAKLCRDTLLAEAAGRDENRLAQIADHIQLIVDPDGRLSGKDPADRAELHLGVKRQDGLTPIRGLLSPLTAEQLRVAIEALAGPKPVDENTPDPRPAPLRREQALGEIMHRHLTGGAGPRDGGVRPQVVVTITLNDLIDAIHRHHTAAANGPAGGQRDTDGADTDGGTGGWTLPDGWAPPDGWAQPDTAADHADTGLARAGGSAWSDYDGIQTAAMARLLACDAAIIPQILGTDSVVLDQGRATRLFTPEQRRALTTRDKGCAFPACDIPAAWCEAHHIIWWSHGGTTNTTTGVLLCRRHHILIHQGHWTIQLDPDGGRPWFIPPRHIDPNQKPRRNNHFHLPDLLTTIKRQ